MILAGKKTKEQIVEAIICENYNNYYRMAYSYVRNEADASDIVQEAAYQAMRHCTELKKPDYAKTWVYRIVMNEIYRVLREKPTVSLDDEETMELKTSDEYEDIDLWRALNTLEPKDKAVIELKYFEELKLEEIAQITGENLNTVKSRLYRALKKLRIVMESEE